MSSNLTADVCDAAFGNGISCFTTILVLIRFHKLTPIFSSNLLASASGMSGES